MIIKAQLKKYKDDNIKFLQENKRKDNVTTTSSGLQYKIIKEGEGKIPTLNQTIKMNYTARLIDDSVFSEETNSKSKVSNAIKGLQEALSIMPVGSIWEIYIPQELAYGDKEINTDIVIKPYSTIIFRIHLLSIESK